MPKTAKLAPRKLTVKQALFAQEYLKDFSASAAARRAGYSHNTARFIGFENLTKPNIREEINSLSEHKAKYEAVTIERVIEEYRRIAFAQTTDMVQLKGGWVTIEDTDNLTVEQKAAISQIKQAKDGSIEVKFYSKQAALDSLGKYLGLFTERLQVESVGPPPVINVIPAVQVNNYHDEPAALPEPKVTESELSD